MMHLFLCRNKFSLTYCRKQMTSDNWEIFTLSAIFLCNQHFFGVNNISIDTFNIRTNISVFMLYIRYCMFCASVRKKKFRNFKCVVDSLNEMFFLKEFILICSLKYVMPVDKIYLTA